MMKLLCESAAGVALTQVTEKIKQAKDSGLANNSMLSSFSWILMQ